MRIFELLSGETATPENPTSAATAPMANMQTPEMGTPSMGTPSMSSAPGASPTAPGAPGAPMKTAGLGDTITNFFSTPQPIGGAKAPAPSTPPPATPGQPPAQTSSPLFPRMFGNTAVGQTLDAVNGGLQPKQ